ncbi:MAG: ABC transporter transmembrane domain-containing protein [Patescibacteria group bacterium]
MNFFTSVRLEQLASLLSRLYNFRNQVNLVNVDFNKPWWKILLQQKFVFAFTLVAEVIQGAYQALTPIIIGYAFINGRVEYVYGFFLGYVLLELLNRQNLKKYLLMTLEMSRSIKVSANTYFLTVDPIFHSTKSSGKIISKIDRASGNIQDAMNSLVGGIVPILSRFLTVVVAVSTLNWLLAVISISSFIIILSFQYFSLRLNLKIFHKEMISKRDRLSAVNIENLQQNSLIRSVFASNEQNKKMIEVARESSLAKANYYFTNGVITTLVRMIYITSVTLIMLVIYNLVEQGSIETNFAIAFIISYLSGSGQIMRLGQIIQNFSDKIAGINDLFKFIRTFGKQTYPVLEDDELIK